MKTCEMVIQTKTIELTEGADGFWLYDVTRSMNLSMKAKTERQAFLEALEYYQERLSRVEREHSDLSSKVQAFVGQFQNEDNEPSWPYG